MVSSSAINFVTLVNSVNPFKVRPTSGSIVALLVNWSRGAEMYNFYRVKLRKNKRAKGSCGE